MDDIRSLLFRRDYFTLEQAKKMTLAEKFFAGGILFEKECQEFRARCRLDHPQWSEERIETALSEICAEVRLAKAETLLLIEQSSRTSSI